MFNQFISIPKTLELHYVVLESKTLTSDFFGPCLPLHRHRVKPRTLAGDWEHAMACVVS